MKRPPPFPLLQSERLTLRAPRAQDASALFALREDPRITAYTGIAPYTRLAQAQEYLQRVHQSFERGQDVVWAIDKKSNPDNLLGLVCLWDGQEDGSMYIGYELCPDEQGKGYMAEAARTVLTYAFSYRSLPAVWADPRADNAASVSLLTKLGFSLHGEQRPAGSAHDHLLFGLLREDWKDGGFTLKE